MFKQKGFLKRGIGKAKVARGLSFGEDYLNAGSALQGILKRSCSHSGVTNEIIDRRNRLSSLRLFRPTTASETVHRIPKLSLTWSENNAVAIFGDTTSEETLDELEDKPSTSKIHRTHNQLPQLSSSLGSLRQTRTTNDSSDRTEESSVRRKKKEGRSCISQDSSTTDQQNVSSASSDVSNIEEKRPSTRTSRHLLRTTQQQTYDEQKPEQKSSENLEEVQSKSLCAGEHKPRLISNITVSEKPPSQEKDKHSNETVRLFLELEGKKDKPNSLVEKETMTESPLYEKPAKPTAISSTPSQHEVEPSVAAYTMHHDVLLQLQAYQNEIAIWRTKAAHLQTLLKENVEKPHKSKKTGSSEKQKKIPVDPHKVCTQYQTIPVSSTEAVVDADGCTSAVCCRTKRKLKNENEKLKNEISSKRKELNDLEAQVESLKATMSQYQNDHSQNCEAMQNMKKDYEQSNAEVQAANLTILRLKNELTTKTKAMEYLEERSQAYRNIILDNDLTVPDESTADWRRGFADPRFVANPSKKVQTQLTSQDLQHSEAHLHDLRDRFKVLKEEHTTNDSNWRVKVREVEESLSAKNYLVDLLTTELEQKEKHIAKLVADHKSVQESLEAKIAELTKAADRIPILQHELDRLQQEKSLMHLKLQDVQEEFDAGLENSLTTSLIKYQEQSAYWTEKMAAANRTNETLRAKIVDLQREQEKMRLRMKVEQADISQRLTSSIQKVDHLRSQINRSTHEVEIEAHPQCNNKYVACKPHTKNKSTHIRKGELFDELEERLKLCKGELAATRRQVEVLQQKLVDTIQTQAEDQNSSLQMRKMTQPIRMDKATEVNSYLETIKEIDLLREKVDQLEQQNFGLTSALSKVEDEKWNLTVSKHQHITQLAAEFEGEMSKYESERCRLINRIKALTKAKLERDCLIRSLKDGALQQLRKTEPHILYRSLSTPHLEKSRMADELDMSRAYNLMLLQMNSELSKKLNVVKCLIDTGIEDRLQKIECNIQKPLPNCLPDETVQNLTSELSQIRKAMESITTELASSNLLQHSARFGDSDSRFLSSDSEKKDEEMMWNELKCLRKALKRSWIDRKILSKQLDRITAKFKNISTRNDRQKNFLQESFDYKKQLPIMRCRSFAGFAKWWDSQAQANVGLLHSDRASSYSSAEEMFYGRPLYNGCYISSGNFSRSTSWNFSKDSLSKTNNNSPNANSI